jgi:type I restriction enzyme M protein
MPTPTPQPDINFEKELWDAANELRGAVSENNYKNYILPLVFVKHLSERYEIIQEEISNLLEDPKSEYYTTNREEKNYVLEDRDEYRSRNTFIVTGNLTGKFLPVFLNEQL